MYTLLVVDDEEYALLGITQGIDWSPLEITRVLGATSADEAEAILSREPVDLVISDIEMPGRNGLDLLARIKEMQVDAHVIFLTGHANFAYAQKALQYGCDEYLLKPVDYQQLAEVVRKVLKTRESNRDMSRRYERYQEKESLLTSQRGTFASHIWKDILTGRTPGDSPRIPKLFRSMEIPMDPESTVTLVLIQIEQWLGEVADNERELMTFAVNNVASEVLLAGSEGLVFQMETDALAAVIYDSPAVDRRADINRNGTRFIEECNTHLSCLLSCYIADPSTLPELQHTYDSLLSLMQNNLTRPNSVLEIRSFHAGETTAIKTPDFREWGVLLESNQIDLLQSHVREYLIRIGEGATSKEMLESFCYGIISMVYSYLHKANVQVGDVFPNRKKLLEGATICTVRQAQTWVQDLLETLTESVSGANRNMSSIVREVKNFIEGHILQDFSREDIANALHFNPDYLSRVFKKETGVILSDYIISRRMTMARKLLEDTNDRVADIAHQLGYNHFSHFARQFRNITGLSPQEYRMKNRKIGPSP